MDDKDRRIEELVTENQALRETIHGLKETIQGLQAIIQTLREEVARLKKNSSNSSKPPSSDIVKPPKILVRRGRKGKRRRGGQAGHAKYERTPFAEDQVDETFEYELAKADAAGLRPLNDWHRVQQIELNDRPFRITEYRARKYIDPRTGRIEIAPLPAEVARGGLVGPKLSALIAYQKSACHMSYTTIQTFLRDVFGVSLSTGQLAKVVQKASAALAGPYDELEAALASQACLGIDETGHPENGQNLWTWCFRADDFTVFHIDPSRGSGVLRQVLGETFGGIIGCDFFSAYRAYRKDADATVQFCMAHLIREIRFLVEHGNRSVAAWAKKLLAWLKKLFHTLHRRDRLTEAGFARSMDRIRRGFLKTARRPPSYADARPLARRFQNPETAKAYFTFLTAPHVEPTNNRTERALRPLVIDRRITQGTRSERGRRWCERAWTMLATCRDQSRSAFEFLHHAILAHFTGHPAPSLLLLPP
jgi:transposase